MPLNQAKYSNAILFIAGQLGGEVKGKKKLAKLLYFADFDFFEKNERPITGDVYKALPMGPFPVGMEGVADALVAEGSLSVKSRQEFAGYEPTEVYQALKPADVTVFEPGELAMLKRVCSKYGGLNGRQLENLTHAEAPYIGTDLNHEIFYELATYRGTDFSDLA
jgi:uncharacterized phage-associated protein